MDSNFNKRLKLRVKSLSNVSFIFQRWIVLINVAISWVAFNRSYPGSSRYIAPFIASYLAFGLQKTVGTCQKVRDMYYVLIIY